MSLIYKRKSTGSSTDRYGTPNVMFDIEELEFLTYLDTWSGFEAAAPWPSRGLQHIGKFLEPSDQ